MLATDARILGPAHNRLLLVRPSTQPTDAKLKRGVVHPDVAEQLLASGWSEYSGPATAIGGWVVPGSDVGLKPRSTFKR